MKENELTFSIKSISQINELGNSIKSIDLNSINNLLNTNNQLEDLKSLTKIRCPYCAKNCICKIDPSNYTISSDCSNNHHYNSSLIEFYNLSLSQQDENLKCSNDNCKTDKKEKLELYYCNCGSILCKKCKIIHEDVYRNNTSHNIIDLKEKDEKCCCDNHFANFSCYCQNCQKNICTNCFNLHKADGHIISFIGNEIIKKNEKDEIGKNIQQQKMDLNKFIEKTDNIVKELKTKINDLKNNLNCFIKINEIIYQSYNKKKLNHEAINNMKNIQTSFDSIFYNFINSDNFKESLFILMNLFEYQKIEERKTLFQRNDDTIQDNKNKNYKFKLNDSINSFNLEEKINVMCELKSKNLLAFGGESGKIYLYDNKKYQKAAFDIMNENQIIKYLCELKDGSLVGCTLNYFKIYEIILENKKKEFNVIQTIEYKEKNNKESKSKVVELTNGNLLSVDGNFVKIWRKKLNTNQYIEEYEIKVDELIFDLFEVNKSKFVVYTINCNILIYDSINYENECQKSSIKNGNVNNWEIVSVQKLNDHTIIFVEKNKILLYSLTTKNITECESPKNMDGLYLINENKSQFYIYYTKKENTQYGIVKYEYSVLKNVYKSIDVNEHLYDQQIGFVYKISANEENENQDNKSLLLIKFNSNNRNNNRNELVRIFEEDNLIN